MSTKICWCGHENLTSWNEKYLVCTKCQSLIYGFDSPPTENVQDDGSFLYGKNYWQTKMMYAYNNMGCRDYKDIVFLHYRERAALWMHHFLQHILPPARLLEIGCGIGSFTHWAKQLGFDASATELSAGWRAFLQENLGIKVTGHMLSSDIQRENSFDAIALFDVLEHIPDPRSFFAGVANELTQEGILMVQTPFYIEGQPATKISRSFSTALISEHVILYSKSSILKLLKEFDFTHVKFYPGLTVSDMLFVASRVPLKSTTADERKTAFATPDTYAAYSALLNYELMLERLQQQISVREFLKRKTPTLIKNFIKRSILKR